MNLSEEQRANLVNQITTSELAPEAKQRVLALLGTPELSEEVLADIRSLIQADIDADISKTVPGFEEKMSEDPEEQAITADGEARIKAVADDLDDSMAFVAAQTAELQKAGSELEGAMTKADVADVRDRLGMTPGA